MIEQKIHAGEFIAFGDVKEYPSALAGSGQLSNGTVKRTIGVSTNRIWQPTKRTVVDGENNAKEHRNFIWLPYQNNAINYIESQGMDVLSGNFSGCYMVSYNYKGSRRVAHIATPEAKATWNGIVAANNDIQIVAGFKPYNTDEDISRLMTSNDTNGQFIFGLITAKDELYSIVSFLQTDKIWFRIASINRRETLQLDQLRRLP